MAVIHISEEEAARDFAGLMSKVRAGEEVRIEGDSDVIAISKIASGKPGRKTLSEAIRLAEERALDVTLDDQFARDLEDVISLHEREARRDLWEE